MYKLGKRFETGVALLNKEFKFIDKKKQSSKEENIVINSDRLKTIMFHLIDMVKENEVQQEKKASHRKIFTITSYAATLVLAIVSFFALTSVPKTSTTELTFVQNKKLENLLSQNVNKSKNTKAVSVTKGGKIIINLKQNTIAYIYDNQKKLIASIQKNVGIDLLPGTYYYRVVNGNELMLDFGNFTVENTVR